MAKDRTARAVQITSFVLHGAALAAIAMISTGNVPQPIAVMMSRIAEPEAQPPPPPPPPPETARREAPRRQHQAQPQQPAADAPTGEPTSGDAAPDYGIALGNIGAGPGGIAVPIGDPGGVRREPGATRQQARTLAPQGERRSNHDRGCTEADIPARQRQLPHVVYTQAALDQHVEGRVRLSVSVGENGAVTAANVLTPIGYGLDEAAVQAVREATFHPATRCGQPVATTIVLGVRFKL